MFSIISYYILIYSIYYHFLPFHFMVIVLSTSGAEGKHQWCEG